MYHKSAMSMPQVMIFLSVTMVVGTLVAPSVGQLKRSTFEITPCERQLEVIGRAITRYRHKHDGQVPWPIGRLAKEGYLEEVNLVCPLFLARRFNDAVAAAKLKRAKSDFAWSSYFLYNQKAFDQAKAKGVFAIGYTEVLEQRKKETPFVLCLEHRESYERRPIGENPLILWVDRDAPLLILRYGGQISRSFEPGTIADHNFPGAEEILRDF